MKQKLLQILLNPLVIAGVVSLVVILFIPDYFSRYQIELHRKELKSLNQLNYYCDLDNDGKFEQLRAQSTPDGISDNASYTIRRANGDFVDQFNFDKPYCTDKKIMWFKDANNNGYKEIYVLTKNVDKAFLNVHEPFGDNPFRRSDIFIDKMGKFNNDFEFRFAKHIIFESTINDKNDLYFAISNGFSANPRNLYKYDFKGNRIIKSPHLTNAFSIEYIVDIDNDSKDEILIQTVAAANSIDSVYSKRSDYKTWLTVLDEDLGFMFEPIEFDAIGSFQPMPIKDGNKIEIVVYFRSRQYDRIPSKLLLVSNRGKIKKEVIVERGKQELYQLPNNTFALHQNKTGLIHIYDNKLNLINRISVEPNHYLYQADIGDTSEKEWVGFHPGMQKISIYDKDFKYKTELKIGFKPGINGQFQCDITKGSNGQNLLYFQDGSGTDLEFYQYKRNPYYFYKYFAYAGIYGAFLGLFLLVAKGQKNIEDKKRAVEKEISKLQLKTIKNQVDPHFVFNAINTISEMTLTDNKLEADKFITRFSGFMRDTLKQSEDISTTLKKELEYTENFIKLQQIRFNNSFNYSIKIDKAVNKKTVIPKHALFTYIENAIKHGLAHTKNGMLTISAIHKPDHLLLAIEDNGGGIQDSKKPKRQSTGSGLKIMDKLFELYNKLYKRKISHNLIELFDEHKNKTGIRVEIKISNPKKD